MYFTVKSQFRHGSHFADYCEYGRPDVSVSKSPVHHLQHRRVLKQLTDSMSIFGKWEQVFDF